MWIAVMQTCVQAADSSDIKIFFTVHGHHQVDTNMGNVSLQGEW